MKADNDTRFTAFSMAFGVLLFVVCVVVSCEHTHHHHRFAAAPTKACAGGGLSGAIICEDAGPHNGGDSVQGAKEK